MLGVGHKRMKKYLYKLLRELKWELRILMGRYNFLFPIFFFLFERRWFSKIYEKNPDIVIEGFGGSANSFAVYAFESAQDRKFKIAHHLHITAQIKRSVILKKPTVIIIRNPKDAVRSLLSRDYYPSAKIGFKHYYLFYSELIKYKSNCVVITFDELTKDAGLMIDKINEKFSTKLLKNEKMNKSAIDSLLNEKKGINSAIPSNDRSYQKEQADILISKYINSRWSINSQEIYKKFVS